MSSWNKKEKELKSESKSDLTIDNELNLYKVELEMQNEELRATEINLVRSLENYAEIFEQAPIGYLILDEKGNIRKINCIGCDLLGEDNTFLKGKPFSVHIHSEIEQDNYYRHRMEVIETGKLKHLECNIIKKNGTVFPVLITSSFKKNVFSDSSHFLVTITDISENKKAEVQLKQFSEDLRHLSLHLLDVREEERKRIGREIHDELGQQLTAIKMDIFWVDKKLPEEMQVVKSKLKNTLELLDGSNLAIKKILTELRPTILDEHGLLEALEWQSRQFTKNTAIPVLFSSSEHSLTLTELVSTHIFRVYQEALTNITRYANATNVYTSLHVKNGALKFFVEDNGQGFDPQLINPEKSFGILGMKERVMLLGGKFDLISSRDKGVKIIIDIPLTN